MITYESNSPELRFSLWKTFRDDIDELAVTEQLEQIASFFSKTPIGSRSIDYYTPGTWASPWEILYHGNFCQSSISLLMYHTIMLLHAYDTRVSLWLIDDNYDRYLLPVIDNRYILNYELGAISSLQEILSDITIIEKINSELIKQFS